MFYNISTEIELTQTIANPDQLEEILGYKGRGQEYGREAAVMTDAAISEKDGEKIAQIPPRAKELLFDGAVFIVLDNYKIYIINKEQFFEWTENPRFRHSVKLSNLWEYPRDKLEISK